MWSEAGVSALIASTQMYPEHRLRQSLSLNKNNFTYNRWTITKLLLSGSKPFFR